TVNNIACTLTGVAHDGTDGWLENRGLFLNANDYVTIPSNTGVIHNSIDFNKTGATFQYVAYNPGGVLFRTDPANLRSYINSDLAVTNTTIKYT
ncbi:hypothetical protein, partial [Lysinibacillus sp. GbtcB16]|uniref:hypothetical protein n=1 Tax=Lysinibacillus sp. GbtcB16 TaxID=2824761 RepID=UPI001C30B97F